MLIFAIKTFTTLTHLPLSLISHHDSNQVVFFSHISIQVVSIWWIKIKCHVVESERGKANRLHMKLGVLQAKPNPWRSPQLSIFTTVLPPSGLVLQSSHSMTQLITWVATLQLQSNQGLLGYLGFDFIVYFPQNGEWAAPGGTAKTRPTRGEVGASSCIFS